MLNRYSGSESQSAGQYSTSDATVLSFPSVLTTRSAGCVAVGHTRNLQATSLLFVLQLSSHDYEMSGASFTACDTQPMSFYEPTVR